MAARVLLCLLASVTFVSCTDPGAAEQWASSPATSIAKQEPRRLSLTGSSSLPITGQLWSPRDLLQCLYLNETSKKTDFVSWHTCPEFTLDADGVLRSGSRCFGPQGEKRDFQFNEDCPADANSKDERRFIWEDGKLKFKSAPSMCLYNQNGWVMQAADCGGNEAGLRWYWHHEMPRGPIRQGSTGRCVKIDGEFDMTLEGSGCEEWTLAHGRIHASSDLKRCWARHEGKVQLWRGCGTGAKYVWYWDAAGRLRSSSDNKCVFVTTGGTMNVADCEDDGDLQITLTDSLGTLWNAETQKCVDIQGGDKAKAKAACNLIFLMDSLGNIRVAPGSDSPTASDVKCLSVEHDSLGHQAKIKACEANMVSDMFLPESGGLLKNVRNGGCLKVESDDKIKTVECNRVDLRQVWTLRPIPSPPASAGGGSPSPSPTSSPPSQSPPPSSSPPSQAPVTIGEPASGPTAAPTSAAPSPTPAPPDATPPSSSPPSSAPPASAPAPTSSPPASAPLATSSPASSPASSPPLPPPPLPAPPVTPPAFSPPSQSSEAPSSSPPSQSSEAPSSSPPSQSSSQPSQGSEPASQPQGSSPAASPMASEPASGPSPGPSQSPAQAKKSPEELLAALSKASEELRNKVFAGEGVSTSSAGGAVTAAFKLAVGSTPAPITVPGTKAGLSIPASALRALGVTGDVAAVASVFNEDSLAEMGAGATAPGETIEVTSAVNFEMHSPSQALTVQGLTEPIVVSLPKTGLSKGGEECAFWDETTKKWSSEGLVTKINADGSLSCETKHLTLFASILRGFLQAFACAQLSLLSSEGMKNFADASWLARPMAIILWFLLAAIALLFYLAYTVDKKRSQTWTDECFLLPTGEVPTAPDQPSACAKCLGGGKKDAEGSELTRAAKVANTAVDKFVMTSMRLQTSATLWLSPDVVDFVCTNKDFQDMLAAERGSTSAPTGKSWNTLNRTILDCMHEQWKSLDRLCSIPPLAARIFVQAVPVVNVFLLCPFRSSCLRLLLLTTKLFGSLFIGALFFQASGDFLEKGAGKECESEGGVGEMIGRIIAIGIASLILGALPMLGLKLIHSRKVVRVDSVDGPLWNKQLKTWRNLDILLWTLATIYCGFCLFFIMLFVANIHPSDTSKWGTSGATSMVKDELIIPFAISFLVPLLAITVLEVANRMSVSSDLRMHSRIEQWKQGDENQSNSRPAMASV